MMFIFSTCNLKEIEKQIIESLVKDRPDLSRKDVGRLTGLTSRTVNRKIVEYGIDDNRSRGRGLRSTVHKRLKKIKTDMKYANSI